MNVRVDNTPPLAAPAFARVTGDGVNVDFAWWGIKGATAFEMRRTEDPQAPPTVLRTLPGGTLGYRDTTGGCDVLITGPRGRFA